VKVRSAVPQRIWGTDWKIIQVKGAALARRQRNRQTDQQRRRSILLDSRSGECSHGQFFRVLRNLLQCPSKKFFMGVKFKMSLKNKRHRCPPRMVLEISFSKPFLGKNLKNGSWNVRKFLRRFSKGYLLIENVLEKCLKKVLENFEAST